MDIPTPNTGTRIFYLAIAVLIAVALLASGAEIGYHEANSSASRSALSANTKTFCQIITTEALTTTPSLKQEVAFATALADAAPSIADHSTALSAESAISAVAANPTAAAIVSSGSFASSSNPLVVAYRGAAANVETLATSVCG
jgi:hypothetical protein